MTRSRRFTPLRLLAVTTALVAVVAAPDSARAGGGPENVLLVVNARSWGSLTVANHYQRLRGIPPINVVYLDWSDDDERIDAETMRTKLLGPIVAEIERRQLNDHIDYVVYSTDFPWLVDGSRDAGAASLPKYVAPYPSLTGATYLYRPFLARRLDYLSMESNRYYRTATASEAPTTHGFRSWYGWDKQGGPLEAGGERYAIAAMLGVTSGRGNSVDEVVDYLAAAVGADFTRPPGTIYFAANEGVRSTTRDGWYRAAVEAIRREGVAAEVVDGVTPVGKTDVMGAMLGTEHFDWRGSKCRILPGAVCEHLTSSGGDLRETASQTPLTESLRAGAAASSGAVTEPYAIPNKFPTAYMHLHYVRGCSAGEAYYQAVHGPYHLLFVGDPLCRPWAAPPKVTVGGFEPDRPASGTLTLTPQADVPPAFDGAMQTVVRFELFVDGVLIDERPAGESFTLDTRRLPDGPHELRIVAVGGEPIETRGSFVAPIDVRNGERRLTFERLGTGPVRWGEPLKLRLAADGVLGTAVLHGTRRLATVQGSAGEVSIDPRVLGLGPVALRAAALGKTGPISNLTARPLEFDVEPSAFSPTYQIPGGGKFEPGLRLTLESGEERLVLTAANDAWIEALGVAAGDSFTIDGFFTVDEDGVYQFRLRHNLKLSLRVDDAPTAEADRTNFESDYVGVPLKRGLHKLEIRAAAREKPRLEVRYGLRGTRRWQPASMTHLPK